MKKIINTPDNCVDEMVEGYALAYKNSIKKIDDARGIIRHNIQNKVAVVIGGGSGHEPLFMGFVGEGLADGAVIGNIFSAPNPNSIQEVVKATENGKGVLFIYGNYSGDVLNFDMASEMLDMEDIKSSTVKVSDDVASASLQQKENRRGIAGDVIVIKIAGAAASDNLSLEEVTRITQKAAERTFSIGVALSSGTNPVTGELAFDLKDDEVEIGMGIHGEPGIEKTKLKTANELVNDLLDSIMEKSSLNDSDEVIILINGLGSTTLMELMIVNKTVDCYLKNKNIKVYDTDINSYCTTQEMAGFSITLTKMDEELKKYYDKPANSPYYKK